MEKTLLRSVIVGLVPDQVIGVVFRGKLQHLTGDFSVVETRRGRGKGGSRLADLKSLQLEVGEDLVTIGTPKNDDILNIRVDGQLFGYTNELEVPANYETNAGRGALLKEQFRGLMDAAETRPMVEIVAPQAPEINGNFTVVEARQLRGRSGQIALVLADADGNTRELWSYRHSGVVDSFIVVGP